MQKTLFVAAVLLTQCLPSFGEASFGLRAVQLDLARQKETVPFVKDYIRRSSRAGFNAVVLYLEDRIKTPSYPYSEDAESYSLADAREFVETAAACGVDLIPVVSPLGHVDRFLRHEELRPFAETYSCEGRFGKTFTTLCLENPRAKAWMEKYLGEVMAVFPGKDFHLGFDETDDLGFCPKCRELVRRDGLGELYVKHLLWAYDIARRHGKRMWIWDDYFMFFPELLKKVPRDVVMCAWNYCPDLETVGFRNNFAGRLRRDVLREYERLGFDCVACPWFDTDNIVRMTEYASSRKCLGLLQTQWEMSNQFHGCHYPRVLASAALWRGDEQTFGDVWLKRGVSAALPTLSDRGVNAVVTLLADQPRLSLRTPSLDLCRNESTPVAAIAAWKGAVAELKQAVSRPGTGDVPPAPLDEAGLLDDIVTRSEVAILLAEARAAARYLTEVTRQTSGSRAAKTTLTGLLSEWRTLCARREAQWKTWREGEPKDLRSLESGFVRFIETCQAVSDVAPDEEWVLELDVMMGDAYGIPRWRVEGRFEGRWKELAKGVWKPAVGAPAYCPKRLPVKIPVRPDGLRITCSGYGEGGLCHVSLCNRKERLVPVKVESVSGRVVDPANLLTDDFRPAWMGEQDGTAAILDPSLAEKESSILLGMESVL